MIAIPWKKPLHNYQFLPLIILFEVMAFIGMCVNIVSGGLAGILLWIVFWFTIIVSGMIFLLSLCNAYNTMLNKFSIMIWLVRSRISDIKYAFNWWSKNRLLFSFGHGYKLFQISGAWIHWTLLTIVRYCNDH